MLLQRMGPGMKNIIWRLVIHLRKIYVPETGETRMELLKKYAEYDRTLEYGCPSEFVLGGEVPEILEKYHYSDYIKNCRVLSRRYGDC